MKSTIIPTPEYLKQDVECIRIAEYTGEDALTINVCLNGLPGIAFHQRNGLCPIENITTRSGRATTHDTLYVYGQMTEPGVMNHSKGPFTTIQVILKPHALQTLLGINASVMTNELVGLTEFSAQELNMQMLEARSERDRVTLLTQFLGVKLNQTKARDSLVEASLSLIHKNIVMITIKDLLETLSISERHFERRFSQTVGVSPHFYIRVKRFNEAIRLMKIGRFDTLTDVAHALNFYDQSHFIRDIKAFSGLTPKTLSQKFDDFHQDQRVYSYL